MSIVFIIEIVAFAVIALLFLAFVLSCFVNVGGDEIALIERRYFGKQMPAGRVIAQTDEVGIQARVLGPGFHFLIPFIYKTVKDSMVKVNDNQVGLIESIDGQPVPPGRIFADVVVGHNSFQDGEAFLLNHGERGPQIQILPPGKYRINQRLFKVTIVPFIVIPTGSVGVVTAQDGEAINSGRLLAASVPDHDSFQNGELFLKNKGQKGPQIDILLPGTYRINTNLFAVDIVSATTINSGNVGLVTSLDGEPMPDNEYVANPVVGHDSYQNGEAFLKAGGQRGPQLEVLRPGIYYINPMMFRVVSDLVTEVQRGQVAVIVSNVGEEPTPDIKERLSVQDVKKEFEVGKETYVVPKGYRGIQEEVAGPGRYYINNVACMPYIINTTNITIDWDNDAQTPFDPLQIFSKDGFSLSVSVKVVIRVRPDQAPYMVAKVGSIENLISHVVHPMIDSSFRNQASETSAMNFMQKRSEEQEKAEERTKAELEKYHVECVSVLICQIILPQELMDTQTRSVIAQQQKLQFLEQQKSEEARISMEKTRSTADQQPSLVKAEMAVKIAEQHKVETVTLAQGEAESIKLKGDGEASKIAAVGKSTADAYKAQKDAIGEHAIMLIEALKQVAAGNIKLIPDILSIGGNASEEGLNNVISKFLSSNLIANAVNKPTAAVVETDGNKPV